MTIVSSCRSPVVFLDCQVNSADASHCSTALGACPGLDQTALFTSQIQDNSASVVGVVLDCLNGVL